MAKRKVYSADVKVWATLYVIAGSAREARRLMREQFGDSIEAGESGDFSGSEFDSPKLPDISFSTSMTVDAKGRLHGFSLADECDVEDEEA